MYWYNLVLATSGWSYLSAGLFNILLPNNSLFGGACNTSNSSMLSADGHLYDKNPRWYMLFHTLEWCARNKIFSCLKKRLEWRNKYFIENISVKKGIFLFWAPKIEHSYTYPHSYDWRGKWYSKKVLKDNILLFWNSLDHSQNWTKKQNFSWLYVLLMSSTHFHTL